MTQTLARTETTWWRRHRAMLLVAGGFLLAVVVAVVLGGDEGRTAKYDPDNAGPAGAQALARVLDDQGIDVTVARSADELDETAVDSDTVVVVTSTEQLGENTIERLLDHTRGSRLVLVEPRPDIVDAVGISAEINPVFPDADVAARCADELFDGLTVEVDSALGYGDDSGCFATDDSSLVLEQNGVTLFGAGEAMTNDQVLRADNAAVSLRLLGQGDNLVWYIPSFEDVGADEGLGVTSLIPRWIQPGLWIVAIATIFLVVWRSRRLGALSTEPLPVSVLAIETTRSRGRLYRKAQDRAHAAAVLRTAARSRAVSRLGLGSQHDEAALIRDLARHTGRPEGEIAALVGSDAEPPTSDHALITLARDLNELDREARRT